MKRLLLLTLMVGWTAACSDHGAPDGLGGTCGQDACDQQASWGAAGATAGEKSSDDGRRAEIAGNEPDEGQLEPEEPTTEQRPTTSLTCGNDGETSYETSCVDLGDQCAEAGGTFFCHDVKPSKECLTWGTCAFLKLTAFVAEVPMPDQQAILSPEAGPQADVSIFECDEDKFCCLFVPGVGDASSDCGGFLSNCTDAGGTASGGNHAAGCQF